MKGDGLEEKIEQLQRDMQHLQPDGKQRKEWDHEVIEYANSVLEKTDAKAFYHKGDPVENILATPIGTAKPLPDLLKLLQVNQSSGGINQTSPGHLGYIPSGGLYAGALADYLAAVTNEYAGVFFGGPTAVRIENMVLRWMSDLIGYPKTSLGNLSSGASLGTTIAFHTARTHHNIVPENIRQSTIYLTQQSHHCIEKALRMAGLEFLQYCYVNVDSDYKMDIADLRKKIVINNAQGQKPFMIIGTAGTTNSGAIDPLQEIAQVCKEENIWFHVDAAYGGFFLLVEEVAQKFKGIELSDSICIDPHKGLFIPFGVGAVIVRDGQLLQQAYGEKGAYMQDTDDATLEISPADLSIELSKHWRGLRVWLPLQLHGVAPFRAALEEKILLCHFFYQEIAQLGFVVGPEPELSICMFRYVPESSVISAANTFNKQLIELIHQDGRVFLTSTKINNIFWIRLAVLAFHTHLTTIRLALTVVKEALEKNIAANNVP